jgi:hypothetical protein
MRRITVMSVLVVVRSISLFYPFSEPMRVYANSQRLAALRAAWL